MVVARYPTKFIQLDFDSMDNENTSDRLFALLEKLIPLVDDLADKWRVLLSLLMGLIGWFGFYLLQLNDWRWQTTMAVLVLVAIPPLILGRLYWSLRDIQQLPDLLDEVEDDLKSTWHGVSTGKRGALNVFKQAKNLYEVRGLLGNADDVIGQYISFGVLVNPLFLILAALAPLFTLLLFFAGVITLFAAAI